MWVARSRIAITLSIVVLLYALLGSRLYGWQVALGGALREMAASQRSVTLPVQASRGRILGRNGLDLNCPEQAWALIIFPGGLTDPDCFARNHAARLGLKVSDLSDSLTASMSPFVLARGLEHQEAMAIISGEWRGALAVPVGQRYGRFSMARHLVGHVRPSDGKGSAGVEASLDRYLDTTGATTITVSVDANHGLIPGLGFSLDEAAAPATDVVLTIDEGFQRVVETVMDRSVKKGAVVILDVATGEVLALASRPNYLQDEVSACLGVPGAPLVNRAVSAFAPGSVFKVVVAAAALEAGLGPARYLCNGEVDVNGLAFGCYLRNEGGHGEIDLTGALAQSCNVAFIKMASLMEPGGLSEYSAGLGIGQGGFLGVPEETSGSLPNLYDLGPRGLANFAIGQGQLLVTPLEMARVVAAVVNDGLMVEPWLVLEIRAQDGETLYRGVPPRAERVMSPQTAAHLRVALGVATTQGTGRRAFVEGAGAAGKTGTAETGRRDASGESVAHAWFVGYFPMDEPRYSVAVLVEEGMSGPLVAAPVFREIAQGIMSLRSPQDLAAWPGPGFSQEIPVLALHSLAQR
jgi:cell division protein FtsI/penicillin-binding protein 2